MSSPAQIASGKSIGTAEWVISFALLAVMVGAYAMTLGWNANTAFFPRLLSGVSIVLILIKLATMAAQVVAGRRSAAAAVTPDNALQTDEIALVSDVDDEEQGNEDEFHKIFSCADRKMWSLTVAWLVLFFGGLYVFGLLVTLPVFTIAYLRVVAGSSWKTCLLYVLGTSGLIYLLFDRLLHLPLPQGLFAIGG